jgi:hypothetical protein
LVSFAVLLEKGLLDQSVLDRVEDALNVLLALVVRLKNGANLVVGHFVHPNRLGRLVEGAKPGVA